MRWTRKHAMGAGIALIAATNAVALLGVAYNRSGEPDSTLRLSQRELGPGYSRASSDNSGLAMRLRWRVLAEDVKNTDAFRWGGMGWGGSPEWLDRDKMAALGFDVSIPDNPDMGARTFRRQLARDVLLVLEMDGPTYQRSLVNAAAAAERVKDMNKEEGAKIAAEIVDHERDLNSRLFVVDAGLDASALRSKYADRSHYAIVRGRVEPSGARISRTYSGFVSTVNIEAINVPLELRSAFEGAMPERLSAYAPAGTRRAAYDATVVFGRRLEPWLAAAARQERSR